MLEEEQNSYIDALQPTELNAVNRNHEPLLAWGNLLGISILDLFAAKCVLLASGLVLEIWHKRAHITCAWDLSKCKDVLIISELCQCYSSVTV